MILLTGKVKFKKDYVDDLFLDYIILQNPATGKKFKVMWDYETVKCENSYGSEYMPIKIECDRPYILDEEAKNPSNKKYFDPMFSEFLKNTMDAMQFIDNTVSICPKIDSWKVRDNIASDIDIEITLAQFYGISASNHIIMPKLKTKKQRKNYKKAKNEAFKKACKERRLAKQKKLQEQQNSNN